MLKKLEFQIISAIAELRKNAYGVPLRENIFENYQRHLSFGALYVALQRLEKRGLVASHSGDIIPIRGNKPKRFYTVTNAGKRKYNDYLIKNSSKTHGPIGGLA